MSEDHDEEKARFDAAVRETAPAARRQAKRFLRDCWNIDLSKLSETERQNALSRIEIAERVVAAYRNAKTGEELYAAIELQDRLFSALGEMAAPANNNDLDPDAPTHH